MFIVCVTFRIIAGQMAAFMPLMTQQATNSITLEPGCCRFDICHGGADADEVFLYEIYRDAAAFQAHLDSTHFKTFDTAVAPMIQSKEVKTYSAVTSG